MVDLARVRRKVADIRAALAALRTLAARSEDEFAADDFVASAAKYKLLVAIEASLDLCTHLCARLLTKAPESYADCFRLLAGGGVLSRETAQRLAAMARFRNLLVHQYGEVDDRRVHRMLRENLGDLDRYLGEVGRHLGQEL